MKACRLSHNIHALAHPFTLLDDLIELTSKREVYLKILNLGTILKSFTYVKLNKTLLFAYWVILHAFLSSAAILVCVVFKINFFDKFFQEHHQSVKQLEPDLGLTVCKDYQQTIKTCHWYTELKVPSGVGKTSPRTSI